MKCSWIGGGGGGGVVRLSGVGVEVWSERKLLMYSVDIEVLCCEDLHTSVRIRRHYTKNTKRFWWWGGRGWWWGRGYC